MSDPLQQLVNTDRTVLVTLWEDGTMQVATREPDGVWGPPVVVRPEPAR